MKKLAFVYFLMAFAVAAACGASLTAILDPLAAEVDESVRLFLCFKGGVPSGTPVFPEVPGLQIVYVGQTNHNSTIDGHSSQVLVLHYAVSASRPGSYTIPQMHVPVDGELLLSPPLQMVVTQYGDEAFIKLAVSKTNVYVGELILIEIKVYGRIIIDALQIPTLKSDGFTIGRAAPAVRSGEKVENASYTVFSFHQTVTPTKAGGIELGPAETTMRVRAKTRRRGKDLFDALPKELPSKQLQVTSETVRLHVVTLPRDNVPAVFSGAIGNFQMMMSAAPTNVSVGDPISLQIQIKGRGSFDTVKLPDFGWKDFTFHAPNAAFTNSDELGMAGIKSFDQDVIPQRVSISQIPPIVFSFFDPDARAYKTIQSPVMPITVKAKE